MLIKLILTTWFVTNFEPLQERIERLATIVTLRYGHRYAQFIELFTCSKCLGFWLSLVLTLDFFSAVTVSIITYTIDLCLRMMSKHS